MLNAVKKSACALAVLATLSTAAMAESVSLGVTGTITPPSCKMALGGNGTIDYGSIDYNSLKRDEFTILDIKSIDFNINCDTPTKVALIAKSERGESAAAHDGDDLAEISSGNALFGGTNIGAAGLGLSGDKGVGGYGLRIDGSTVNINGTRRGIVLSSDDNGSAWSKSTYGSFFNNTAVRYMSLSYPEATGPVSVKTLSANLDVQAYINKATKLDISKETALDGMVTIELVYL
ncbi:DUF1120 domain-containing protein [Enterobacter sp. Cy-643]|uniref:DUF1120 domain-containing protein n=1 Tax=Enterobacter sp. Cy-643 TaxID=2608346 RepID=UPI00141E9658|nr:DUF1120 domain-containing protein [Enterobacter sp. Cy-643]NIF32819.1 DUF1120 domain-containing protein [Enterobacter sp. Cy-643]